MKGKRPSKLAQALEALKTLQEAGPCFAIRGGAILGSANTKVLLENGFLESVMKGWYIPSSPAHAGTTVTWYASYWGFVAAYCDFRFGDEWCLTPEESLLVISGANIIPSQVVVRVKKGSNSVQILPHGTSILNFTATLPAHITVESEYGLRVYSMEEALLRCSPGFFIEHPNEARACLNALQAGEELTTAIESFGGEAYVGRLVGALRAVGRTELADAILSTRRLQGRRVEESNPFARVFDKIELPDVSPIATRLRLMWRDLRARVLELLPARGPVVSRSVEEVLKDIDAGYVADSYHSLSIEGYRVSEELIRRVRDGEWNPMENADDRDRKSALAASGYYRAYRRVRSAIERILSGDSAGEIIAAEVLAWHRELFMPSVDAGILTKSNLERYRSSQVYIAGSRYTPPSAAKVPGAMGVYLDLLRNEPDSRVRAILGHFFFVHIHPFPDGNGRTARFVMNASLVAGGDGWVVIPVEKREAYMKSLEVASVEGRIDDFVALVLSGGA